MPPVPYNKHRAVGSQLLGQRSETEYLYVQKILTRLSDTAAVGQ